MCAMAYGSDLHFITVAMSLSLNVQAFLQGKLEVLKDWCHTPVSA